MQPFPFLPQPIFKFQAVTGKAWQEIIIGLMVASQMPSLVMPLLVTESCLPGMPQVGGLFSLTTAVPACWLAT
jgi:hypothetical protein